MKTGVQFVRYGEATYDGVNVIYWQTYKGTRHFITLVLDWYADGRLPADAMRLFVPEAKLSAYTDFDYMDRMYNIPGKHIRCENASGDPFIPYDIPEDL